MALAVVAIAGPATASAQNLTWTHGGSHLGNGIHATQSFKGFLDFTLKEVPGLTKHGVFGCEVTATITAVGPSGGTVTKFDPVTNSCVGEGFFNECELVNDVSTVPWTVDLKPTDIDVTNIKITNTYANCESGVGGSVLEFGSVTITPHLEGGLIKELTVSGTSTNTLVTATGTLGLDGAATLGLT